MAKVKRYSNFYTTMSDLCITHMSGYSFISRYQKKMIEVQRCSGLGLEDPFDERHIQTIVHTVKILSVSDLLVNNISRAPLSSVVSWVFPT
jgi:hypothetical protein